MVDGNRMRVIMNDPIDVLTWGQLPDFTKPVKFTSKIVDLERVRFYDSLRLDKDGLPEFVYEIWVPPPGDYTDREIKIMRSHCEYADVRFQLHRPEEKR